MGFINRPTKMGISPHGVLLMVFTIVFTVITTLVIALRLWALYLSKNGLKLHDYLVLLAYVCIIHFHIINRYLYSTD